MSGSSADGRILILGATGLLGASLTTHFAAIGAVLATHGRGTGAMHSVDLADREAAHALMDLVKPDVLVNLAGLTNVDECEAHLDRAYDINSRIVENIAAWIEAKGRRAHLVHISTDQVYDGHGPHAEPHVSMRNVYALSKYCGELAAAHVSSTVLRTNFFGKSQCAKRQSFSDWLHGSLLTGESIHVFDDLYFSPLSMRRLASIIELIVNIRPIGVFNLGSHHGMSKADFAFAFARALQRPAPGFTRTSIERSGKLKAYRPRDMRMDCGKIEAALKIRLPDLTDEIEFVAGEYDDQA